jgi:chaperonin GroES
MKPLKDRMLAEVLLEPKNESGIILLSQPKNLAKVLFIGPEVQYVKIGDTVRFDPNSAIKIDYENKDCVFINEGVSSLFIVDSSENDTLSLKTEFHKNIYN